MELYPDPLFAANVYYDSGFAYYKLEQYAKAIADYDKAIELNPKYAIAYISRGIAYDNLKRYDKAIADYNKAIELNPAYAGAYINRGNAYNDLKQYDKAIADYNKAIGLNPAYADAYSNRGNTYLWLKKCGKAKTDFEKAIKLDSKNAVAYENLGVFWWVCRKDKAAALKWFEESFKRGFDQWDEHYQETSDGYFLKGMNNTPEFKALVKKYKGGKKRKNAAAGWTAGYQKESPKSDMAGDIATTTSDTAAAPGRLLPSGVRFIPIKDGYGDYPFPGDTVKVHYHGTLMGGGVFDSSVDRGIPAEFSLKAVIPCWTAGLQEMRVGEKATLICPPKTAYGKKGNPPDVPPDATLVYKIELLDIVR